MLRTSKDLNKNLSPPHQDTPSYKQCIPLNMGTLGPSPVVHTKRLTMKTEINNRNKNVIPKINILC